LAPWPSRERVGAEAGKGRERGGQLANEARAAEAAGRPSAMGLDVLHTPPALQRVLHRQWKQAERQREAAAQADAKVQQAHQEGREARGGAWRKAERRCAEAVQADAAAHRLKTSLALLQPEGGRSERQWAPAPRRDASALLTGPAGGKVRRFLQAQRTLHHLAWVPAPRDQVVADPLLRASFTRLWSLGVAMKSTHDQPCARLAQVVVMAPMVWQRRCPEWQAIDARVEQMLSRVVRARSAGECLHSVVRRPQSRHRHVSQERLDRKRLSWHCRALRHGKRTGARPYALRGRRRPTYDWWQLLQMDPKALEQKLLTQEVRA
jgi:hypothetical protein